MGEIIAYQFIPPDFGSASLELLLAHISMHKKFTTSRIVRIVITGEGQNLGGEQLTFGNVHEMWT